MKPLVKWSGGKREEIQLFKSFIPLTYDTYIEPFFGGGAVYFNIGPEKAVINDIHPGLMNFYKNVKEGKGKEICKFVKETGVSEETYYYIRDTFPTLTSLDEAKRFYYLRKTCYRGMMRYNKKGKFNIPFGRYKTINCDDLLNDDYFNLLKGTEILNKSFEEVFKAYDKQGNFMFLDPPYDTKFTDYGYCTFDSE